MLKKEKSLPWETIYKLPFNKGLKIEYHTKRRFANNVSQVPDLTFTNDPSLSLHKAFMLERWLVDKDITFAFISDIFYREEVDEERLEKVKELVGFIERELPGAKFIVSAENFATDADHDPSTRDAHVFSHYLLKKPSKKALWPDDCWFWGDYRTTGADHIFEFNPETTDTSDARGKRVISPPFENQYSKKSFYVRCSVPPDRRMKWCRLGFDIVFENGMESLFELTKNYVFAVHSHVPNEIWQTEPANQAIERRGEKLKFSNGKINRNLTHFDSSTNTLKVVVDFHSMLPEILFRFDYDFRAFPELKLKEFDSQDEHGLAVVENICFYDNPILDDERDCGISKEEHWMSLDGSASVNPDSLPPDHWLQIFKFNSWTPAFHRIELLQKVLRNIDRIAGAFKQSSSFSGFFLESNNLSLQGWDYDWKRGVSVGDVLGWYYNEISKYVAEIGKELKVWAFGDMLNPYHNGKPYFRAINPSFGGIATTNHNISNLSNVCFVEWGYGNPIGASVDYILNSGARWAIGVTYDRDPWVVNQEKNLDQIFPRISGNNEENNVVGCFEFGDSNFREIGLTETNEISLRNVYRFANELLTLEQVKKVSFIDLKKKDEE